MIQAEENIQREREREGMEETLRSASAIADQRQKIEQYKLILSSVLSSNDLLQAKHFIDHSKRISLFSKFSREEIDFVWVNKIILQFCRMMCRW